ncbi:MAG TPA: HU family DNA-binding protein [Candidatus Ozemobacteraceae bacterium]|nr:HU family DNA-binding protein [Candidatus Ozemobacteraceae bacterium]
MKKIELVKEIARNTNLSQNQAAQALEATIDIIKTALRKKEEIRLVGFGSFKVTTRQSRMGVNPQTKKAIKIPATNVAKFVPGKELKDMVNHNRK